MHTSSTSSATKFGRRDSPPQRHASGRRPRMCARNSSRMARQTIVRRRTTTTRRRRRRWSATLSQTSTAHTSPCRRSSSTRTRRAQRLAPLPHRRRRRRAKRRRPQPSRRPPAPSRAFSSRTSHTQPCPITSFLQSPPAQSASGPLRTRPRPSACRSGSGSVPGTMLRPRSAARNNALSTLRKRPKRPSPGGHSCVAMRAEMVS